MNISHLYTTIDTHTGGEPLRIIIGGIPPLKGDTMLERTAYFRELMDSEGYGTMYGHEIIAVVTAMIETGCLQVTEVTAQIVIDCPAGKVSQRSGGRGGSQVHLF